MKNSKRWLTLMIAVLTLVAAVGCRQTPAESAPREQYTANGIPLPDWVEVDLIPPNEYSRPQTPLETVTALVVHYVGNPNTSASANRNYFAGLAQSGATYASSHFIIDLDGSVLLCLPLNEQAYCTRTRNTDTIGIECCHPDETGRFTEETYRSLVKLTAWLNRAYGLEASSLLRHYDVTGKICPKYFVDHAEEWDGFRQDVAAEMQRQAAQTTTHT